MNQLHGIAQTICNARNISGNKTLWRFREIKRSKGEVAEPN